MTLADNIHRLTTEHMTMTDGKTQKVPSLLDQLDAAITSETRAGSPGGGRGLPIGAGAYALLQDITTAARDEQYQRTGSDVGKLPAIIQSWATEQDAEMVNYLEHVTLDWCDQIRAIIAPSKPPRRLTIPCPACGVVYDKEGNGPGLRVHCWGPDEELVAPGEWTAECIHCGAGWNADNMTWLARMSEVA